MSLTVFGCKGIPPTRRERIEAAVTAGGTNADVCYEAWTMTDPFGGDVRVVITGRHGFARHVAFAANEDPSEISRRVRETIGEET